MLPKSYTRADYDSIGYAHNNGKVLSNFTRDAKLAAECRENTRAKVLVVTNSVTGSVGNLKLWPIPPSYSIVHRATYNAVTYSR